MNRKSMNQFQSARLQRPQRLSRLATLAIWSKVIFLASAWLLPIISEYGLLGDNISELVLGRYGFVQTTAFVISGLGTIGLAFVIRELTAGLSGSLIGSLLVGFYGLGAILAAIFPTDRVDSQADVWMQSTTGTIHIFVALASLIGIIIGMFMLTRTLMMITQWRQLARWLMLCPAGTLSLFFAQTEGPLVGLLQRLLVTLISVWLILVALKVRQLSSVAERGAFS